MNEVVLCTNDVLCNDVTPCGVNDVALRANGIRPVVLYAGIKLIFS